LTNQSVDYTVVLYLQNIKIIGDQ